MLLRTERRLLMQRLRAGDASMLIHAGMAVDGSADDFRMRKRVDFCVCVSNHSFLLHFKYKFNQQNVHLMNNTIADGSQFTQFANSQFTAPVRHLR